MIESHSKDMAWKLDYSENTKRMRKRLKRHYHASKHTGCAKHSISTNKDVLSEDSFILVGKEVEIRKKKEEEEKNKKLEQEKKEAERAIQEAKKHQIGLALGLGLVFSELQVTAFVSFAGG